MRRALAGLFVAAALFGFASSEWVSFGPDHKLRYRTDERGNRVMDFSFAGYGGGGVRLPEVAAVKTLAPAAGDNTAQIQAALGCVGTSMECATAIAFLVSPAAAYIVGETLEVNGGQLTL